MVNCTHSGLPVDLENLENLEGPGTQNWGLESTENVKNVLAEALKNI